MIRFRFRRGHIEYMWFVWSGWCKIGLHFMEKRFDLDGYSCPCRKQFLWNEDNSR